MKPSQLPWKWLLVGLLAVLVFAIALIPWLIGDTSRFGDRIASELSAWTGGEVKFVGPVRVRFLPDVSVRGQLEVQDSTRLPAVQTLIVREAKVSLDLVDLLRGRITIDALRLLKPRITLRDTSLAGASAATPAQDLITSLLGGAPVRVLHVRNGRITLPADRSGAIKDIYAHIDAGKDTGAVSGFGSFAYKDTTMRYSLESGSPTASGGVESFPLALMLFSKPLRVRLNGTASYAGEFKLDGDMQAEIDDGRKLLNWLGVRLPPGDSLKGFSASGAFHLAGLALTFDDGTFTLDGNKAVGLLALSARGLRPRVEGTLAFDRLTLDPYLGKASSSDGAPSTASTASFPFNRPLLQFIDADLRISAAAIDAGALKLGRGGFTVSAKQGVVASEVGELELCGGSADGRLDVDLSQPSKQVNLVANLDNVAINTCLQPLSLAAPISGNANVKTELAAQGSDPSLFTGSLAGTLKLKAKDGAVPVDFARLLAGPTPLNDDGWSHDNATPFDQLDADCRLGTGHIWCQSLSMRTPQGTISGAGDVDVTKRTLDWSLAVASPLGPAGASQLTQAEAPKVSIRGSLLQPIIRRADRPTLGDGSLPTGSTGPQVVPH
ncbi:MAG TPA: AsmA family protein [Methyloceanibacter sp.]|nr:AsmA family protein [Methyloceanibacter sp.]